MQGMQNAGKKATLNQLVDAWRSKKAGAGQQYATAMSRDDNEWLVGQLMLSGLLQLEFGFTAYSTNTYLKLTHAAESFIAAKTKKR